MTTDIRSIMIEAHRIARTLVGDYAARLSYGMKAAWATARKAARLDAAKAAYEAIRAENAQRASRMSQKDIARMLDNAAARAEYAGACPASSRQCWYLAGLLMQDGGNPADIFGGNTNYALTMQRASHWIDTINGN